MKKIILTILVLCSFSITKASSTKITKEITESELLKTTDSKAVVVNPLLPAANPTVTPSRVLSLFSNAYPNAPVTTWRTGWSAGSNLTDLKILGNDTKQYDSLGFFGVDLTTPVDATLSNVFHIDIWTPDVTEFKIKFVDLGANGSFGGGDDVEHELTLTLGTFGWNNIDIPMSDFTGLVTKGHIAQVIFSGTAGGTIFLDNLYFSFDKPRIPAPSPIVNAAGALSLFSNTYTNIPMDSWRAFGAGSNLTNFQIAGNDIKKYDAVAFWAAELAGTLNASSATSFRFDIWTIDMIAFKVKLVDLGPNGIFGGGDDVEHEVSRTPIVEGWNSFNIPMSEFTNLTTKGHIKLLIFSSDSAGSTVFLDNIYFTVPIPSIAAPRPNRPSHQVLSIYSDTYPSLSGIDWNPNFGQSTILTDILIQGNRTKRYTNLNYQGVVFSSPVNASSMTNLHLDVYTPNCTSFDVFLGSGPEQKVTLTPTQSGWNSFDIPLSQYTIIDKANIGLMKFEAAPFGTSTVYIDNIYFWNDQLTALMNGYRSATLSNLHAVFFASSVPGATTYRFEITKVSDATKTVINSSVRSLILSQLLASDPTGLVTYATEYSIRVAVNNGGYAYGPAYSVFTPVKKTFMLSCGATLDKLQSVIAADLTPYATEYRFKITRVGGGTTTIEQPGRLFYLTSLLDNESSGGAGLAKYNTSYSISAQARIDGDWTPESPSCTYTTPSPVTYMMQCGSTLAKLNSIIYADVAGQAAEYRFEVSGPGGTRTIDVPGAVRSFNLTQVSPAGVLGQTYSVRVAIRLTTGGPFQAYSASCTYTTPLARMSAEELSSEIFNVKAFPNPFASHFSLDIESSSDDIVEMKVYDMIGRQLEVRKASVSELSVQEVGHNYPSGVYNVIVSQGDKVKSVRMVKR